MINIDLSPLPLHLVCGYFINMDIRPMFFDENQWRFNITLKNDSRFKICIRHIHNYTQMKVLYCHQLFREETLTSMEPLHCTEGS